MSDFIDEDLLKDWFEEAYSQIESIESNLLTLENDTGNAEAIDSIFRAAHTLKGGSATVQMEEISKFTHILEDAMDEVRSGKVKVNSSIVDILLDALDIIKNMIEARSNGTIFSKDIGATVALLKQVSSGNTKENSDDKKRPVQGVSSKKESGVIKGADIAEYDLLEIKQANTDNLPLYKVIVSFDEANPMRTVGGIQVFTALRDIGQILKTYPDFDDLYSEDFHLVVTYILSTDIDPDKIISFCTIPDTTVEHIIEPLNGGDRISTKSDIDRTEVSLHQTSKAPVHTTSSMHHETKHIQKVNDIIKEEQEDAPKKPSMKEASGKTNTSSVLRVDSSRIDDLLNLVSEIVINKATFNQINSQFFDNIENLAFSISNFKDKIKQYADNMTLTTSEKSINQIKKDFLKEFAAVTGQFDQFGGQYKTIIERFKSTTQNLDRISADLREGVMRVRMIQIKQVFSRFPRLVRDLSRDLKKDIELVVEGEETEVDKAMLDDLIDPLIHMVRNAIDHGFETPEERIKLGKKNPGILKLKAINEGNLISIYISDNGKGIDSEKVRKKAIANNLISSDKVLREQDIFALLFEPGFSTAEKVTSVSGRGVGLDVVKRNIEKLSGSIRVNSTIGKGTTFAVKLPLTLAIIQGLMVKVQGDVYALPISSVLESIRISPDEIKSIDNYEVINVRDDVLSLLRLSRLFNLGDDEIKEFYFVVIVGVGDKKIGLLVDTLIGEEDIVIKPLKDKYTNTPGIAGATVLGDGMVSLILDVSQLIELGLKQEIEHYQSRGNKNKGVIR